MKTQYYLFIITFIVGRQWLAGPYFNQGVGGSIPALVNVFLSNTLNPELSTLKIAI